MKVSIEGNELVIRMPMNSVPQPSASGKTLVIASSHGNQKFQDVTVQGKPITIGFNAYISK